MDELFLWDPVQRRRVLLESLPLEVDGVRLSSAESLEGYRAKNRYSDSILRTWSVSALNAADSTRFHIEAYAPRPGNSAREYEVEFTMGVPDTVREKDNVYASIDKACAARRVRIGPSEATLDLAVSDDVMRSLMRPYGRRMRTGSRGKYSTNVEVHLKPVPLPGDEKSLGPGLRDGSLGKDRWTNVEIPVR